MNIGNKIYELRSAKNLSQGDLAELLEVSRQSVSKWETDNAVPELDKLIKMCEIFGVTLDELAGRSTSQAPKNEPCEQNESRSFTPQKFIGCVLIAVSFIAMVLTLLLAEGKDELYVLFSLIAPPLVCGVICLCVKKHIAYWCAWSAFAPVCVLGPHMVGLPIFTAMIFLKAAICVFMAYIASKQFSASEVTIKKTSRLFIIIMWIVFLAADAAVILFSPSAGGFLAPFFFVISNYATYCALALLVTYTVCYLKAVKA